MKRVFFLGAGATIEDFPKAPSLKTLLWAMLGDNPEDECSVFRNKVHDFISQYFFNLNGKSISQYPSIQDVLSFIDAGLLNNAYFQIDKKYFEEIRDAIVYLMGATIEKQMYVAAGANTLRLVEQLEPADVVISTNYDIVVDNCFLHKFKNCVNYGAKFRQSINAKNKWSNTDAAMPSDVPAYSIDFGPSLLKLHGSFNWLYCSRCDELDVTVAQKGLLECMSNKVYCYDHFSCTARYQPLIVSPTFLKDYKNRIISEVWSLAEQAIAKADQIIFIGYSMPLDDYEIKSMFLRGISRNINRPIINVIDKFPQIKDNYEKVFGLVGFSELGFAEYARNL